MLCPHLDGGPPRPTAAFVLELMPWNGVCTHPLWSRLAHSPEPQASPALLLELQKLGLRGSQGSWVAPRSIFILSYSMLSGDGFCF